MFGCCCVAVFVFVLRLFVGCVLLLCGFTFCCFCCVVVRLLGFGFVVFVLVEMLFEILLFYVRVLLCSVVY